jgi:hypothetical protein
MGGGGRREKESRQAEYEVAVLVKIVVRLCRGVALRGVGGL